MILKVRKKFDFTLLTLTWKQSEPAWVEYRRTLNQWQISTGSHRYAAPERVF